MIKFLTALLAVSVMSAVSFAQDATNSSNVKASDVTPPEETQKDIDKEITNARMRAALGSKSKWSVKTSLGYNGSTVERPFADIRPEITDGIDPSELAELYGSVGVKLSLSERDSVSVGTSFGIQTPFSGDLSRSTFADPRKAGATEDRFKVSSPSISYSHARKVGDFQMGSDVSYTHQTDTIQIVDKSSVGSIGLSQSLLTDFNGSAWSAGASISIGLPIYSGAVSKFGQQEGMRQVDYSYGIYPFAEYSFNDRYSARTVFGYFSNYRLRDAGGDGAAVRSSVPYQSIGVGISLNRDIYLYPNLQFTPFEAKTERTNVAMSAYINMF